MYPAIQSFYRRFARMTSAQRLLTALFLATSSVAPLAAFGIYLLSSLEGEPLFDGMTYGELYDSKNCTDIREKNLNGWGYHHYTECPNNSSLAILNDALQEILDVNNRNGGKIAGGVISIIMSLPLFLIFLIGVCISLDLLTRHSIRRYVQNAPGEVRHQRDFIIHPDNMDIDYSDEVDSDVEDEAEDSEIEVSRPEVVIDGTEVGNAIAIITQGEQPPVVNTITVSANNVTRLFGAMTLQEDITQVGELEVPIAHEALDVSDAQVALEVSDGAEVTNSEDHPLIQSIGRPIQAGAPDANFIRLFGAMTIQDDSASNSKHKFQTQI